MLLVTGTGFVVHGIGASQTREQIRSQHLDSCRAQAGQLADTLGSELVHDQFLPKLAKSRERVLGALQRLLKHSENGLAIYSLTYQDDRAIIVQEAIRDGLPRPYGTPVALPNAGHRAHRTHAVQTGVFERNGAQIVQTFAPIHNDDRLVLGLLVTESALKYPEVQGSDTWLAVAISIAAGLLAIALLMITTVRPLERLQDQLIAKQSLSPKLVQTPADLLREITCIVDTANSERDFFNARLKQQDRQSESSIRRKDEVISNTVHELRTPLTSIIASLEIMIDNKEMMTPEEKQEFMAQASTAARHMMFVVNDMLDASAIKAGHINMQIEPCNLGQMLRDAQRSMEIIATARAMILEVVDLNPNIEVMADSARLMQVLFNLVSNAVKHTPSGTTITIRAWPSLKSIIIEVEDQGQSIPVELRDRLFTKFSKFERHEPRVDSSGIGLYLSKKLVELMHGSIGYRAIESGDGSVFWFMLPLVTEESRLQSANS